jgi:predicted aspartyl protease
LSAATPPRAARRALLALAPIGLARCAGSPEAACRFGAPNIVPVTIANGLPFVPMSVNGWPVTALLDTGAEVTLVSDRLLPSLGLPIDPRRQTFQMGATGRTGTRPMAALPRVRLGTLELERHPASVVAAPGVPGPGGSPPQVVLGGDILARHDMDLDLPGGRIALYPAQRCRLDAPPLPGPAYAVPMRTSRNHILAPVEVNGRAAEALLDTGANLIQLSRSRALQLGVTEAEIAAGPQRGIRGINNAVQMTSMVRLGALRIGPETLRDVPAVIGEDGSVDFIIGTPWLLRRRLFVSHVNQRLFIVAPAA